jgi:hypothetical protein
MRLELRSTHYTTPQIPSEFRQVNGYALHGNKAAREFVRSVRPARVAR